MEKELNLKVIGARCIVKEENPEAKTQGGIILTSADKQRTYTGTVLVTGEGAFLENGDIRPMRVNAGDKVIFAKFAGTPIDHDGEQYIILNERDILVVIPKN